MARDDGFKGVLAPFGPVRERPLNGLVGFKNGLVWNVGLHSFVDTVTREASGELGWHAGLSLGGCSTLTGRVAADEGDESVM